MRACRSCVYPVRMVFSKSASGSLSRSKKADFDSDTDCDCEESSHGLARAYLRTSACLFGVTPLGVQKRLKPSLRTGSRIGSQYCGHCFYPRADSGSVPRARQRTTAADQGTQASAGSSPGPGWVGVVNRSSTLGSETVVFWSFLAGSVMLVPLTAGETDSCAAGRSWAPVRLLRHHIATVPVTSSKETKVPLSRTFIILLPAS